jgi:hypothetical protein
MKKKEMKKKELTLKQRVKYLEQRNDCTNHEVKFLGTQVLELANIIFSPEIKRRGKK